MRIMLRILVGIPVLLLAERRRRKKKRGWDIDFDSCGDILGGGDSDGGSSGD